MIRLQLDGELPTGRAIAHDRLERPFTGWLGLMGAIQALIVEDDPPDVGRDPSPGAGELDPSPGSAEPDPREGHSA